MFLKDRIAHLPDQPGIYMIRNTFNGKVYIGQSVNQRARCYTHILSMRRNKGVSLHLLRAYSKYGMGAFEFSSLEICTLPELDPREEFWIQELRSFERDKGYNIALKASGPGLLPQESRDKISKHRLTHKRKPFSDEARQRMSVAHQGVKRQPLSEETKKKISESRRGQKPSKETRQKMSLSHKKS